MKKYLYGVLAIVFCVTMFGCGKKQASLEEQEPLSMETLSTLNVNQTMPEMKGTVGKVEVTAAVPAAPGIKLESLPPTGPYKPTGLEIQTALKNARFYEGTVDGKVGPKTRSAIKDFQKANGLQADGKVGPKTWGLLSKFLNPVEASSPASRKKR